MWRTSRTNWRTLASAIFSTHFLFPVTVDMACNIVWGKYHKGAYHRMAEDDSIAKQYRWSPRKYTVSYVHL